MTLSMSDSKTLAEIGAPLRVMIDALPDYMRSDVTLSALLTDDEAEEWDRLGIAPSVVLPPLYRARHTGRRSAIENTQAKGGRNSSRSLDSYADQARDFLDLNRVDRARRMAELKGTDSDPINFGLDVLQLRGERAEEVQRWRNRKGAKPGSAWLLAPQDRDPATLSKRYRSWRERLERTGWTGVEDRLPRQPSPLKPNEAD